jgi:prepilin-type N-terminal cleavage/methylation domain-containing protein
MSLRPRPPVAGFSLTELLMVLAVFGILAAIAVPISVSITEQMRVTNARREVESELQTARLRAVSVNRSLQLRLNCPSTGRYRIVEVMKSGIDNSTNRCSDTTYPFRGIRDDDPATPDFDGALRELPLGVTFGSSALVVFQFAPDGRTVTISGSTEQGIGATGVNVSVQKGTYTGTINVNSLGRITAQ